MAKTKSKTARAGRPPKEEADLRDRPVHLRLTAEEEEQWRAAAAEVGHTALSPWIRWVVSQWISRAK